MHNSKFLKALSFIAYAVIIAKVQSTKNESLLIKHLLKDYDILSRPVEEEDDQVVLRIGLALHQLIEVNEKQQSITTNLWMYLLWNDTNLIWEPNEFGNISTIKIPSDLLWKPDIQPYNRASAANDVHVADIHSVIYHNGSVTYVPPLILKSTCKMDVTWFPFDEQKCVIKFGSWTYAAKEIDIQLYYQPGSGSAVNMEAYLDNGEWILLGVDTVRNVAYYPCCPEPYINVVYTVHIKRRSLYYFFNLIVPCALIGFLALLGFTLPPDSGEKLSLGVTVLFSLIVFLNMISSSMPANSDAVPLLGTYFNCVMVMIASSVVSTIVINLNLRSSRIREISGRQKQIFFYWLPWILRINPPFCLEENPSAKLNFVNAADEDFKRIVSGEVVRLQDADGRGQRDFQVMKRSVSEEQVKLQWKFVALVVDRICFLVSIVFAIMATIVLLVSAL